MTEEEMVKFTVMALQRDGRMGYQDASRDPEQVVNAIRWTRRASFLARRISGRQVEVTRHLSDDGVYTAIVELTPVPADPIYPMAVDDHCNGI